ncbi:MAG: hypothetical protein QNI96_01350 [Woeseiaceae bacterium]|nr:hypothetical protein [Woeseiaceae bacterium]
MFRYICKALDDPLFLRVGMALWSIPMFVVAGFFAYEWRCGFEISWFLLIPAIAMLMGLWLAYSSLFVDDAEIQRRSELLGGAGTEWFTVASLIVAVPIYELLKLVRRRKGDA